MSFLGKCLAVGYRINPGSPAYRATRALQRAPAREMDYRSGFCGEQLCGRKVIIQRTKWPLCEGTSKRITQKDTGKTKRTPAKQNGNVKLDIPVPNVKSNAFPIIYFPHRCIFLLGGDEKKVNRLFRWKIIAFVGKTFSLIDKIFAFSSWDIGFARWMF